MSGAYHHPDRAISVRLIVQAVKLLSFPSHSPAGRDVVQRSPLPAFWSALGCRGYSEPLPDFFLASSLTNPELRNNVELQTCSFEEWQLVAFGCRVGSEFVSWIPPDWLHPSRSGSNTSRGFLDSAAE